MEEFQQRYSGKQQERNKVSVLGFMSTLSSYT